MYETSDRSHWSPPPIEASWQWSETEIKAWQLDQLNRQFQNVLPQNRFYRAKLGKPSLQLSELEQLAELPTTSKQELVESAAQDPGGISQHHTLDVANYSRLHRTSGTTGQPLMLLDTVDDWKWWSATWQHVLQSAELTHLDRVFLAFSFGPFIGFWSAHQACVDRGAMVIPGGGLSSLARLEFMRQSRATVVCCTPSYALHLAEVARQENISLADLGVTRLIVAGEAGGSIPSIRQQMEQAWQAQIIDHSGATEIGPWGFGWPQQPGLQVIETSFIAELLPIASAGGSSQLFELVLTSLGRYGAPLFRYRTGDVVHRPNRMGRCGFLWLPDGVVGRTDNMVTIRGVNIFPSSIDAIVRQLAEIAEYQVIVDRQGALDRLQLEIEAGEEQRLQLEKLLITQLGLRIPVRQVAANSLPRSELKSRRWRDQRG